MAFKLLHEKLAATSTKDRAWVSALPTQFDTPFHWTDEQLALLQSPALVTKVQQQRQDWRRFYNRWQYSTSSNVSTGSTAVSASQVSFEQFVWAMEACNSRAFSGPYEGTTAAERLSLLAFTAVLTVLWPALHLTTLEQSSSLACVAVLLLFLRDLLTSRTGAYKRYVLCPGIDLFNHMSTCMSDVSYNYFWDCFELRVGKAPPTAVTMEKTTEQGIQQQPTPVQSPISAQALTPAATPTAKYTPVPSQQQSDLSYLPGEQVFISYGKQSNDRFLQYYGFVEPDNPNDVYDFGASIVDLLIKYADRFDQAGVPGASYSVPQQPTALERLRWIARAVTLSIHTAEESAQPRRRRENTTHTVQYSRRAQEASPDQPAPPRPLLLHYDSTTVHALRALYCTPLEFESRASAVSGTSPTLRAFAVPCCNTTEDAVVWALRRIAALELQSLSTLPAVSTAEQTAPDSRSSSNESKSNRSQAACKGDRHTVWDAEERWEAMGSEAPHDTAQALALLYRTEKRQLLSEAAFGL
jgi:hypothetical protein